MQYGINHGQQPLRGPLPTTQRRNQSRGPNDGASKLREDLPSKKEGRRSDASKSFSNVMDHLQSNIFIAGQRLNDLTGYSGIEALKKDIERQEEHVEATRKALQAAREAYSTAISQRSSSQRKVNELLQRKHNWSPQDLEQFTALYRSDHTNEQAESVAQDNLVKMERMAEEAAANLSSSILARYHEEQIWSDKIRRMSTWGTWGLMGVNVLLFLVFQIGVEPWRRKRLVKGFEDKVMEALEREGSVNAHDLQATQNKSVSEESSDDNSAKSLSLEDEAVNLTEPETDTVLLVNESQPSENILIELEAGNALSHDAKFSKYGFRDIGTAVQDLFSSRQILLRQVDVTALILEAGTAGMVVATAILMLLRSRSG